MAKHVTITIKVAYDEASLPDHDQLEYFLQEEVDRAIANGMLSPTGEEIPEEINVEVE